MLIIATANKNIPTAELPASGYRVGFKSTLSAKRQRLAVSTPCFVVKGIIIPKNNDVKPNF